MPRKIAMNKKSFTTEKHYTTVPPKAAVPVATAVATAPAVATVPVPAAAPVPAKAMKAVDIKPFLIALRDLDADVAREAATSLGAAGDASAVEPLIEVVQDSQHYFHSVVRSAAAVSLGQLKDRRAVEALLQAVNDPIVDPSIEAIRALVTLGDPRVTDALVAVVGNANGFFTNSVRRAAVLGLITLGGAVATAELRRVAGNPAEDAVIREEAAVAVK